MITTKNVDKFESWIKQQGGEILPVTNEYELIRFKGSEVGVIYKSGKTSNTYTINTISSFLRGKKWMGKPIKTGRKTTYKKEKIQLLKRDGDRCFYCNKRLLDDITVEHLIPLSSGGKNSLSNMVLAHEKCNNKVSNKTIVEKVKLAIFHRTK